MREKGFWKKKENRIKVIDDLITLKQWDIDTFIREFKFKDFALVNAKALVSVYSRREHVIKEYTSDFCIEYKTQDKRNKVSSLPRKTSRYYYSTQFILDIDKIRNPNESRVEFINNLNRAKLRVNGFPFSTIFSNINELKYNYRKYFNLRGD